MPITLSQWQAMSREYQSLIPYKQIPRGEMQEPLWEDLEEWEGRCDGSKCPICLEGEPKDVVAELQ